MLAATAAALEAQAPKGPLRFGAQGNYSNDTGHAGFGAWVQHSVSAALGTSRIYGHGEVNWFPGSGILDLNLNVIYRFRSPQITPYAGGGPAFRIATGAGHTGSDLHLSALGGLEFRPLGPVTPFIQLRYLFAGADAVTLSLGIFF